MRYCTKLKKIMRLSTHKLLSIVFIFCWLLFSTAFVRAENNVFLSQDEAKAVLLYNFIKHTEWQATKKPIVEVGFLGVPEAQVQEFKRIANEASVHGRSISPQILTDYTHAGRLEVLVLGVKYNRRLAEIASSISRTQTLIISDGAHDRTSAMINFTYPKSDKISFEVNKNNIIFEGLKVSNDVMLYGGTEIEVADLYNQMEAALVLVKKKLRQQEAVLFEQQKTIAKQSEQIHDHYALMTTKNKLIVEQTKASNDLSLELQIVDNNLNQSQYQLAQSENKINQAKKDLVASQLASVQLEQDIEANKGILIEQVSEISRQGEQLKAQSNELNSQEGTIELQRNVILAAFGLLFCISAVIIFRQKRALEKEQLLLAKEARLVVAQQASLDAYEMTLKVKNDFIMAINHEFKTPMHIMNSALYNIEQGDEVDANLDFLMSGSEQMTRLVEDMLMYSELQSEDASPYVTCAPIRKEITAAVDLFKERAAAKSIELHCEISENLPPFVLVDILKLRGVIEKVLCNACKFTERGMIDVSVRCVTTDFTQLIINISDTGIGIAPDALENIFDPFMQRETGLSRRYDGLGIGLSICKSVMQLLGGDVVVTSTLGEGTEVLLSLPIQMPVADQMPTSVTFGASDLPVVHDKHILLVEDNDVSRLVMEKLLRGLGYTCTSAENGLKALDMLKEQNSDIVLMDIQMPVMNGIECTRLLRAANGFQPPVIALTANLTEHIRRECLNVGMSAVLSKPVSTKELADTLNTYVSHNSISAHQ